MKKFIIAFLSGIFICSMPAIAFAGSIVNEIVYMVHLREVGIRFIINLVSIFILVRIIYFTRHRNKDFRFTFILFNFINFLICFLLSGAELQVSFAFGLFAIFSIMRYRTVTVPVKEMGYLFMCVALGLINALATTGDNHVLLIACNAFVLILALLLDWKIPSRATDDYIHSRQIIYERIDLIKPANYNRLLEDLRDRTGLPVFKVNVLSVDFLHDTALVSAYYHSKEQENNTKQETKLINSYVSRKK